MSVNIKMMKFLLVLAVIFGGLTYFLSVNIEKHIIVLHSDWISNNLAFTLSSSIFASVILLLLNEFRQYKIAKRRNQDILFSQMGFLYGQALIMQNNMRRCVENSEEIVSDILLDQSVFLCRQSLSNIENIDYETFVIKDKVCQVILAIRKDKTLLETFFTECIHLKMAINEDRLYNLQTTGNYGNITAESPKTRQVLLILQKKLLPMLVEINSLLEEFDKSVGGRYRWSTIRDDMQLYENGYTPSSLSDFLQNG